MTQAAPQNESRAPQKAAPPQDEKRQVPIFVWGKRYLVPEGLTIITAMEYAGYQLVRGCGCRGGICGACSTVYRRDGECKIEVGLACQTVVQPGMYIAAIPFFPARRMPSKLEDFKVGALDQILHLYPEVLKCMGCNTCTKGCPMEINVMKYISAIIRGNVPEAAHLSFDCVQCGICAARCPAEISQYHVAQLVRRIFGRHHLPKAQHLQVRAKQVQEGRYDKWLAEAMDLPKDELKQRYKTYQLQANMEPQDSKPGWTPKNMEFI